MYNFENPSITIEGIKILMKQIYLILSILNQCRIKRPMEDYRLNLTVRSYFHATLLI